MTLLVMLWEMVADDCLSWILKNLDLARWLIEAENREYAEKELKMLSDRFYANTVMEDWDYELTEIETFPPGIE